MLQPLWVRIYCRMIYLSLHLIHIQTVGYLLHSWMCKLSGWAKHKEKASGWRARVERLAQGRRRDTARYVISPEAHGRIVSFFLFKSLYLHTWITRNIFFISWGYFQHSFSNDHTWLPKWPNFWQMPCITQLHSRQASFDPHSLRRPCMERLLSERRRLSMELSPSRAAFPPSLPPSISLPSLPPTEGHYFHQTSRVL